MERSGQTRSAAAETEEMEIEPFCSSYLPEFPEESAVMREDMLYWSFPSPDHGVASAAFDPPSDAFDFISSFFDAPPMQSQPPPQPETPKSAFARYVRPSHCQDPRGLGGKSVHKRMVEFLRGIPMESPRRTAEKEAKAESSDGDGGSSSRCFRHMMRERQRRERLSQSYADLYSMVSLRSKADKNSIVQSSAAYLRELKAAENRLRRQNQDLRAMAAGKGTTSEGAKIRLRVGNPCSPIDSLIGALQCLKGMDVRARSVRSYSSGHELSAAIDIDTDMATKEVETAVQGVLVEAEKRLRRTHQPQQVARSIGWPSGRQVAYMGLP